MSVCAAAHTAEYEEIKEVHAAEDEQHHADFDGKGFNALFRRLNGVAEFQSQTDVAEVDQVKADDEQVINRVGEGFVAVEDVNQEDASVFVEGAADPDGQRDAEGQVDQVSA